MRKNSYLTVTDLFCGAGGSSLGAQKAGVHVSMAANHWKLAIETHQLNFPATKHDNADISQVNPRRYPVTDILIASPECTNHSLAKGQKRSAQPQESFFGCDTCVRDGEANCQRHSDSVIRSRATMWDVPRFAEHHRYACVIVENVDDARKWECWDAWLASMHALGYRHRIVSLNSMFAHPTPQSRDRMYVVFWRKGNRAPDLDIRPRAFCPRCAINVESLQAWKNGRVAGKYKQQYVYACPRCAAALQPYYYAALNALDPNLPAQRIGDRKRPLKERTMGRIRYGLEKYGRHPLLITTNMTSDGGRSRPVTAPGFTQTGSSITALLSPERRARLLDEAMPTQTTRQELALVSPFLVTAGSLETAPPGAADPMPAHTASGRFAAVIHPSFIASLRGTGDDQIPFTSVSVVAPLGTVSAGGVHAALVTRAAILNLRDYRTIQQLVAGVTDHLPTQVATPQTAIVQRAPFLVSYYGQSNASGSHEAVDTVTTVDRHALVQPADEINVEDCYFRMLQPHEIGAAMAFPSTYVVLGNKRDQVKQYGNAVTPPAMEELIRRCVASLHPEAAA
jgi:DNA (cytosine-5)-methyltransferase 1